MHEYNPAAPVTASTSQYWPSDDLPQASNFRRVLGCPGSPRFHFQKAVRWIPVAGGDMGGALQLNFLSRKALSASADGEVPKF